IAVIIIIAILVRDRFRNTPSQTYQAQKQSTPALPTPTNTPSETPAHTSPSPAPAHQNDQKKPPVPRRPTAPVYSFLLSPGGVVRADGGVTPVPKKSGPIEFQLPLTGTANYRSYEASLEKENGQPIQTWTVKPTRIISG